MESWNILVLFYLNGLLQIVYSGLGIALSLSFSSSSFSGASSRDCCLIKFYFYFTVRFWQHNQSGSALTSTYKNTLLPELSIVDPLEIIVRTLLVRFGLNLCRCKIVHAYSNRFPSNRPARVSASCPVIKYWKAVDRSGWICTIDVFENGLRAQSLRKFYLQSCCLSLPVPGNITHNP